MLTYIGVGSNIGDPAANCRRAIEAIVSEEKNRLLKCSPLYRTEPVGKEDQDWFVNGAVAVETSFRPRELMECLLKIERGMGREREERWGPRVIDLDILFYGGEVVREEDLQIPHPRLHERRFVLIPLNDLAPDLYHPLLAKTISQILSELKEEKKVVLYSEAGPRPCPV